VGECHWADVEVLGGGLRDTAASLVVRFGAVLAFVTLRVPKTSSALVTAISITDAGLN
jgi:hypothetical protein